ncbi:MAG TPA: helix-turn-helix domain-containing protein, partial [Polyangiaceae bacterium]|nr:helix-turn-helix domain-containing protein [Polyangiaceae bacterium]
DLDAAGRGLEEAAGELEACGDLENAGFVSMLTVRRLVLLGRLGEAARTLSSLDLGRAPPRMVAMARLLEVEIAVRSVEPKAARSALDLARQAARSARIAALAAEVERAAQSLALPVARLHVAGVERPIDLGEAAVIVRSRELVVDACRREVRAGRVVVSLIARPVLFALAVTLAEAFPAGASRGALVRQAFSARAASDSLRARLRVEVGRLRHAVEGLATLRATSEGFALEPVRGTRVLLLRPPFPGEASALLAVLATGESWSSSGLAAALGAGQRTVQRALLALLADDRVRAIGRGRSRRWTAPPSAGFATPLLLSRAAASELEDLS